MVKPSGPMRSSADPASPRKPLWTILFGVAALAAAVYSLTGGLLSSHAGVAIPSRFEILAAVFPPLAFLVLAAHGSPFQRWVWLLCLGAGIWVVANPIRGAQPLQWAYLADHVVPNVSLGLLFGRSLRGNAQPYCSRIAEKLHGNLSPLLTRYTRGVTVAWTVFFWTVALCSVVLFAAAPFNIWTRFAWFSTLPLLLFMFSIEYLLRFFFLPAHERSGPIEVIRTLLQHL